MKSIGYALTIALIATGCVVGAPPGFSDGDKWTVPLVGPLEADVFIVPVKINGKGPYLFYVDPDSAASGVDDAVAKELELYTQQGAEETNELDRRIPVFLAEVQKLQVGDLTVRNLKVRLHRFGTYWVQGRRVRGLLGRDVIADSLVFQADRDSGWATIATQGHLSPPENATAVKYRRFFHRKLAKVAIDGHKATMHIDLGTPFTQLWSTKIKDWGLGTTADKRRLTDEWGTIWETSLGARAQSVQVANHNASNVLIVPYGDKRREEEELDGSLGQNFLVDYNITANWHKKTIWLQPRGNEHATAKQRIRRWGSYFDGCKQDACVAVNVISNEPVQQPPGEAPSVPAPETAPQLPMDGEPDTAGGAPGAPRDPVPPANYQLHIEREASVLELEYEILLEAVDADGKPLGLPRLLVTMPKGARTVLEPGMDPNYAAAAGFAVLDLSPFARDCQRGESGTRCVWTVPLR